MIQKSLVVIFAVIAATGCVSPTGNVAAGENVREFYMESFYTIEDGKPHPQFSLKEIEVRIDELGVYEATGTGKVTVVEFVADKAGEFVYYCTVPGHRENGQWGVLRVKESGVQ